jgi:hypothetical protein
MMNKKYLTVLLLLAAVLLAPLNAFAHDVTSGAAQDACVCHLLDHTSDETDGQADHNPDSQGEDCCDCEGCCPDATEPSIFSGLNVNISSSQLFHPPANRFFPKVYLTIFVPPESCSLT